ncbi:hypothetical protein [Paenibacillus elgii]|uniref:hypothetical protein n=1 Tax=Paenibacillus elgii TaxID=189691 RepID=UPI0013D4DE81|nr:hypothetical protein [Paenibacillus elgii]
MLLKQLTHRRRCPCGDEAGARISRELQTRHSFPEQPDPGCPVSSKRAGGGGRSIGGNV